jgi:asparagine synthase (glutamine-hydrolysing)
MCGIAGIIRKDDGPVDRDEIERITELVAHRGPDGVGHHLDGQLALGHRRLAIFDTSPRGRQPMSYRDRYWITYNGAIYNYLELRKQLEGLGSVLQSDTDTEVILAAYAQWGAECLSRFIGMWSFAIYDRSERTVFLARDRFGVKPLYYLDDARRFAFGSELKQLLALQREVRANRGIVVESLLTHFGNHTTDTYFAGIKSLPSGHYLRYSLDTHTQSLHRYYELAINTDARELALEGAVSAFRDAFNDSVRLRLRSDVPVAVALSGGIDSAAVCAAAAAESMRNNGRKLLAIHGRSSETKSDESRFARLCADRAGIDLSVVTPSLDDFRSTIDEIAYTQEEPYGGPSMFMGWHVCRRAKEAGRRVMLSGQGADETLLGYERYYAAMMRTRSLASMPSELWQQSRHSSRPVGDLLKYFFYFGNLGIRKRRLLARSYLRDHVKQAHDWHFLARSTESFSNIEKLQRLEIESVQLPRLLRYDDRNSMRHAIETRVPFLDHRVVEFAVSIPAEYKIRHGWTKYVLRKAFGDALPREVAWREEKIGFEAPEHTWLTAHEPEMIEEIRRSQILQEIVDTPRLTANYCALSLKERWSYYSVAVWERIYRVGW